MTVRRHWKRIWGDVVHAVCVGTVFATALCGIVILIYYTDGPERFLTISLTPLKVIGLYYFGAVTGGIVFGLLRPATKSRLSAAMVGAVAFAPLICATYVLVWGNPAEWEAGLWAALVVSSVVLGGAHTYIWWDL